MIVWASLIYQRRLQPRYKGVRDQVGVLSGTLNNNLGGIATIKAFTAEDREAERVGIESAAYAEANANAIRLSSAFVPLIRIAILCGFTITLLVGGNMVINGTLERRLLLGAGVHDPAPPVAPHEARRDLRPLPARDGIDAADLRPARREAHDHRGPLDAAEARRRRGAVRRRALQLQHRPRGAPRPRHRRPRRRDPRRRRPHRSRQEHDREAPAAALRGELAAA